MVKVLLSGDVGSHWDALHARVEKLHASTHGPFDVVLCAGFSDLSVSSIPAWPLPVYVLGTITDTDDQPKWTSTNLHVVSENSVVMISGLHVAFLADPSAVHSFRSALTAQPIDILISTDYPQGFERLVSLEQVPPPLQHVGLQSVAEAAEIAVPRYHIAATHGLFYQRLPYVTSHGATRHVTRFIGLGQVGASPDKDKKWMHALNLDVLAPGSAVDIPAGTTQSPYGATKRPLQNNIAFQPRKRSGLSAEKAHELMQQSGQHATKHSFYDHTQHARLPNRQECWFCLSTPTVEMHLIVSIGNEAYLAIPKGPIVPDHALIVPIQHTASMLSISAAARAEVNQFKAALKAFYASQGKAMIVLDRNVTTMGAAHGHLQVIPVPAALAPSVVDAFHEEGKKYNVNFSHLADEAEIEEPEYLLVECPGADETASPQRLLHAVKGKHYMQFGRDAVAALLKVPRRGNWKYCVVPKDQEEKMAQAFKAAFAPFDFSLALE
ncbi:hypothetical protein H310_01717 [Aphanomyces invadans]|uniref:HIT domain-containing protein n=1 Tax=Aphanomyces invadans TaxID=157072 RepID=A0A024UTR0_9STRA|nr:hypothetical protein H310_01717 [Aphanomyces invadans]ETW09345.1 hypothetical protein H310_01717 [Aphanomyces invadans]|eukprot:XP_008863150.1 hypothetical protein H310_01717 [Aphanomyces invadans]